MGMRAIKKICNNPNRPGINGYHINEDNQMEMTDSYRAYRLNKIDNIDIPEIKDGFPDISIFFSDFDEEEVVKLDYNDIIKAYKTRDKKGRTLYELKSKSYRVTVDIVYLKENYELLGKDIKACLYGEYKPVLFINNENEKGIVCPVKEV